MIATLGCQPTSVDVAIRSGLRLADYQQRIAELDRLVVGSLHTNGREAAEELTGLSVQPPTVRYIT